MKKSILDIGSNSVRLIVVANGIVIHRKKITSQLGKNMLDGYLNSESILRTVKAVGILVKEALSYDCDLKDIYAFATAAVRNSKNSDDFLTLANSFLHNKIDVISGETEGEIALLGVLNYDDGAVLDIGGASSELTVRNGGKIVYSHSLKLGAVLLYDMAGADRKKLAEIIENGVQEYDNPKIDSLFAVGGTATSIAFMDIGCEAYDRDKVHMHVITEQALSSLVDKLFTMTDKEIEEFFKISCERSKIIRGGALLMLAVMKKLNLEKITVSENDNLEGYYRKLFGGENE